MKVVIVTFRDGGCSIRTEDGRWWCGAYGWVHPDSSYWHTTPSCWNNLFTTVDSAREAAVMNEWIVVGVVEGP